MGQFWRYLGGTVIKPRSTFNHLLADPKAVSQGFKAVLFIGILYTLTVIGLAIVRADIATPAWIAIPAENYYFWEIFFALPVFLMGWILGTGLVQLLSKALKGNGTFESTLAVSGFALTVPMFVTWIPETVGAVLFILGIVTQKEWLEITSRPGFWQVFAAAYQFIALAWLLALVLVAIAASQKLRWWQAVFVGVPVIAITGLLMFVFIR